MRRIAWLCFNVIAVGVATKILSHLTGAPPRDVLTLFIFVKVADIQFCINKG